MAIIKDVAKINERSIGKSFPFQEIEYIDIDSVNEGIISKPKKICLSEAPSRARRIVRVNDIIISTVRPNLRHFAFIKNVSLNTVVSTGFAVVTPTKIEAAYLYYFLSTEKYTNFLSAIAESHTSTYPSFNPDIIENSTIPLPPKQEQYAIAKILSDLDSKIELNEQMNKTLEAIGQALFKHWFIDFEFPNEQGKPYKSSNGKLIHSEPGFIPASWTVKTLREVSSELVRGFTTDYVKKSQTINLNQKVNRGPYLDKSNYKFYPDDTIIPKEKFARFGDILINSLGQGTLGRVHLFLETVSNVVIDQHISIVRPLKDFLAEYLYFFLTDSASQLRLHANVTGSTGMQMLNISMIRNFKIILPEEKIIQRYSKFVSNLFLLKQRNILESEKLAEIRNALLPKLMSGQIRVPV